MVNAPTGAVRIWLMMVDRFRSAHQCTVQRPVAVVSEGVSD